MAIDRVEVSATMQLKAQRTAHGATSSLSNVHKAGGLIGRNGNMSKVPCFIGIIGQFPPWPTLFVGRMGSIVKEKASLNGLLAGNKRKDTAEQQQPYAALLQKRTISKKTKHEHSRKEPSSVDVFSKSFSLPYFKMVERRSLV